MRTNAQTLAAIATMWIVVWHASACALPHQGIAPRPDREDTAAMEDLVMPMDVVFADVVDVPARDLGVDRIIIRADVPIDMGGCPGVDLTSDPSNCGTCGHVCPGFAGVMSVCRSSVCGLQCPAGQHLCVDHCAADNSTTECGGPCAPCPVTPNGTASCVTNMCALRCNAGYMQTPAGQCVMMPPSSCGNRALDAGETCDDGNTTDGDGCSAACAMETGATAEYCSPAPTRAIVIDRPGTYIYTGTTVGATGDTSPSTMCAGYGPDVAMLVRINIAGTFSYTVTATPTTWWDLMLRHGTPCPTDGCEDMYFDGGAESYSNASNTPVSINIVIDGFRSGDLGPFVLRIVVT